MRTAVILFTYHRSYHTGQVLASLRNNTIQPEKLVVFQDGLKKDEDDVEWRKVNQMIQDIDWCDKEVIISEQNKGLANSVTAGIDYVFGEYDAVIVIEDDCVLAPGFMQFMLQALEQYEHNPKVYSVSGYSWPIRLEKDDHDAFCCGRVSTLGWGTWRDRWAEYAMDAGTLKRLKSDREKSARLAIWGSDLEDMLLGTISGRYDSWGVYWALNVIEKGGICINPYTPLVKHIGWDDTSTNAEQNDMPEIELLDTRTVTHYSLPDDMTIADRIKRAFADLHGCPAAVAEHDSSKENVLVYGLGNFYRWNEKAVSAAYHIRAYVDRKKRGWYAGKEIITVNGIARYDFDKILIMVMNIQECIRIVGDLIGQGVRVEQIILGISLYGDSGKYVDSIKVLQEGDAVRLALSIKGTTLRVRSEDEYYNTYDAMVNQIWDYAISNGREDIILDVGMNIGDTVLYFLNKKNVKKVYGYEPFHKTYADAAENLGGYLQSAERVEIFPYGISDESAWRTIGYNKDMSCGQSTIAEIREDAYAWYQNAGLVKSEYEEQEKIQVKDAAAVFLPIMQKHSDCNMILKMNCEGEEYSIIKRLAEEKLLGQFTVVMLEWHYKGKESITRYLEETGFTYWCNDKNDQMGLIYAYKQ